jgi:plastocyanin
MRHDRNISLIVICALFMTLTAAAACMAGEIKGDVTAQGMKSPAGIVVYIDAIPGKTFSPPSNHEVIDQKKMTFIPHVLAILKGTTVDFLNSDPVGHNVYWPSISGNKKLGRNLGTWPQGVKKSFTFDDLGSVPLLCNVHPEMSAYVVVVPTPYFAIVDKEGKYAIKDVPPGSYTLRAWSEEGKPLSQSVQVADSGTTVNLTVHR